MTQLAEICTFLENLAPRFLAESWDNVGLLIGDPARRVERVLTCLTLTPDVAREAVERRADLIVSHHPILFRPVQKITAETTEGRLVLLLIENRIAIFSPHTCYDSAADGINQQLARQFELHEIQPIRPLKSAGSSPLSDAGDSFGSGRWGSFAPRPLADFLRQVREQLHVPQLAYVGSLDKIIQTVAIACGSAAEFLPDARRLGCDVLLTGEARFHAALEAREADIALVLAGHFQTERPGVEALARLLAAQFSQLDIWPSDVETDPLHWA